MLLHFFSDEAVLSFNKIFLMKKKKKKILVTCLYLVILLMGFRLGLRIFFFFFFFLVLGKYGEGGLVGFAPQCLGTTRVAGITWVSLEPQDWAMRSYAMRK